MPASIGEMQRMGSMPMRGGRTRPANDQTQGNDRVLAKEVGEPRPHRLAVLVVVVAWAAVIAVTGCTSESSNSPGGPGTTVNGLASDAKPSEPNTQAMLDQYRAILPNGRMVTPAGTKYDVGTFPTGVVVSPDGRLAVTVNNGRGTGGKISPTSACDDFGKDDRCSYLPGNTSTEPTQREDDESLSVIDLESGQVTDVFAVPTDPDNKIYNYFSLGIEFGADGKHLYVTGGGNDSVYDFTVDGNRVQSPPKITKLPSAVSARGKQPVLGDVKGYSKGVAVSPDQKTVLVVKEYDNDISVLDASTLELRQQISLDAPAAVFGSYLYDVAFAPDGARAYVSGQGTGMLHALTRGADGQWSKSAEVRVGDHPTGIAVNNDNTLMVANANDDTVAVVDGSSMKLLQKVKVHALDNVTWGATPNAVTFTKTGTRAYVALAGDDSTAVLERSGAGATGEWKAIGFIPSAWYPTGVAVHPSGDVITVSAKGLGGRYIRGRNTPPAPSAGGPQASDSSANYSKKNMPGIVNRVPEPKAADLDAYTKTVRENIGFVVRDLSRSPDNPIPAKTGDPSPIKHVIYVVRENRTFDQVFGDLGQSRADVDADPRFEILATATPNAHKLLGWGGTGDRFFSNGEASIQGHWWTAASNVSDYTEKGWLQEGDRGRPYDFVVPTTQTKGCTVFGAAQKKKDTTGGAFTYKNYGEPLGYLIVDSGTGKEVDPCPKVPPEAQFRPLLEDIQDLSIDDRTRVPQFLADVGLDANGQPVGDPATNFLPNFSYLTLPQDHTTGMSGKNTPRAQVAQNDVALGLLVQSVSKSKYWKDTAIIVVEDDSQDGPDHVDGHRNILLVLSPYAKKLGGDGKAPGYVSHQHLDQSSVVRTIGLIFGWEPLAAYDQLALPLYDLFQDVGDPSKLSPDDLRPYEPAPPPAYVEETTASVGTNKAVRLKAESASLRLDTWDVAGPRLESILWESVTDRPIPDDLQYKLAHPDQFPTGAEDEDDGDNDGRDDDESEASDDHGTVGDSRSGREPDRDGDG